MATYPNPIRVPEYTPRDALTYGTREAFADRYVNGISTVVPHYSGAVEAASWMVDSDTFADFWSAGKTTDGDRAHIAAEWLACEVRVQADPTITY